MGVFHSSPARSGHGTSTLGPHGPSLAPRRGRRLNWWEVLKLGAVTVGVGALQWLKLYFLMLDDREARQRLHHRRGRRLTEEEQAAQKGLGSNLSPASRQAVIGMIDHIVTPMLVDQWRLSLVKVLLDPEDGPVLPEEDPDMRKVLLASLQSYQAERDARPTFRPGQEPVRYSRPSAQSTLPRQDRLGQAEGRPSSSRLNQKDQRADRPLQQAGPSAVLSEHRPTGSAETPSAPPLDPSSQTPSAPLPPDDWQLVEAVQEEPATPPEECGVCLDAKVEVEIDNCHHHLCSECAKAICCLEGRAPQCPFCRGAMTGVTALAA